VAEKVFGRFIGLINEKDQPPWVTPLSEKPQESQDYFVSTYA
jgi:hypothetical protein